jgi:outer membrane protein assembly factor BamB
MKTAVAVLAVLVFVLPLNAQPANSPWPMFHCNTLRTGLGGYAGPQSATLSWSYQAGNDISASSPAIDSDGNVYFGAYDHNIYAVNANGGLVWSYETAGDVDGSPAIASGGRVYIGSYDNNLYAINSNGALAWSYLTQDWIPGPPLIGPDGRVFVGSEDNCVYALNSNGGLAWSYETWSGIYYSAPAIGPSGKVYIIPDGDSLCVLSPNGSFAWSYYAGYMDASVAIGAGESVHYGGGDDLAVYALTSVGQLLWSYWTDGTVYTSPAIGSDGRVYSGADDGRFYCIASSGSLAWSFNAGTSFEYRSSAAIGSDGRIYVGSPGNNIMCLNSNGTLHWTHTTGGEVRSSPAIGSDGRIYVGSQDGIMYAIGIPVTPTPTNTPGGPTPTPTPPIDLTADKAEYGTTGSISVTADVWPLTVPCYPFVRIQMADGSTLYYQRGMGFTASPVPYLGFAAGTVMTTEPIMGYPALSENFSGIPTGPYVLEGGAVDMMKTTSASNLIYFGTVDREVLRVK